MKIWQENNEPLPSIKFSTNLVEAGFTDITSIANFFEYGEEYGLTKNQVLQYSIELVNDWATEAQSDKDLIIAFIEENTFVASVTTAIRADITAPYSGFEIFNTDSSKVEWWNGAVWYSTTAGAGRNNTKIINTKADFVAVATSHIGNEIKLPTYVYSIGDDIDIDGDYLCFDTNSIVSFTSGGVKNTVLTSSGLLTALIVVADSEVGIRGMTLENRAGSIFDCANVAKDKEFILDGCVIQNTLSLGTISGFFDIHFEENHFALFNEGLTIDSSVRHIHFSNNFITHSRFSGSGATTFLTFDNFVNETIEITNTSFTSKSAGDKIIDVSSGATFSVNAVIQRNIFTAYTVNPIVGTNGNTANWHIPSGTNVGYIGLVKQFLNWGVDGAFGTTSTTNLSPIVTTDALTNYGKWASSVKCMLQISVTHQQAGKTVRIEINDVTNGNVAVAGSAVDTIIASANSYTVVNTPEVSLNPSNEYNVKVTNVDGTGNNLAGARSAVFKLKIF